MADLTYRTRLWGAARVAAAAIALSGGASMAEPLPDPVNVKIDFFDRMEVSRDWLAGAMAGLGAPTGYSITSDGFEATDSVALVAANRIKAFYTETRLAGPNPWLLLPMQREDGTPVDCVTNAARQMIPSLEPGDFGKRFAVSTLRTDTPEACLIDPEADDPFEGVSRAELRAYFDEAGDLLADHRALKTDPHFIRALLLAGFYTEVQDASSNLRVS